MCEVQHAPVSPRFSRIRADTTVKKNDPAPAFDQPIASMSPSCIALAIAFARLMALSLSRARSRWTRTVSIDTFRMLATSSVVLPRATHIRHSISREANLGTRLPGRKLPNFCEATR
jgi:hypothetical protein